ncbi:hypothetical protein TNCV_205271 [Trichonephila clavipes]|nr:hypothetical protein TNCV_205271 [Trichonephila clavipes]
MFLKNISKSNFQALEAQPMAHRRSFSSHAVHQQQNNSTSSFHLPDFIPDTALSVPSNPDGHRISVDSVD